MTTDADRRAREDHADEARIERDQDRRVGSGDYLSQGEYMDALIARAARPSPDVAMLRASADAMDKITAAVRSQETAEWAIAEVARMRPVFDAVTQLTDALDNGLSIDDDRAEFLDLFGEVRGAVDRSRGLGIGQVTT